MNGISALTSRMGQTLRDPRGTAHGLMQLGLPRPVLWQALIAVSIVSTLIGEASQWVFDMIAQPVTPLMLPGPLIFAIMQTGLLVVTVWLVLGIGRACGGHGRLEDGMILLTWLEVLRICVQAVQILVLLLSPLLSSLTGAIGLLVMAWVFTHFVAAMHGFTSLIKVFAMIAASFVAAAFVLSILLTLAGVQVIEVPANV
ncbi:hypothetical protein EKE94_03875 [Mesobaculum littorinae]|uniref:Yip1 domain-containing protein n=1 Tax=Mesobaculum littorinae TaxID=2486419 RepID=A0A438AME4_9RHOB|nr:YIP1 family protein [Mesobaculum littorinae]RVV99820.1 hypothetical protein EKE94_03875 [Mesobaculum littorinae]